MDRIYPDRGHTQLTPSVIVSTALHALLAVVWNFLAQSHHSSLPKETIQVEWGEAKPKSKANDPIRDKAVVKTDTAIGKKPITKKAYLNNKDRRVDRETVARNTDMKE